MSTPILIFILIPSSRWLSPTAATTTKGSTRHSLSGIAAGATRRTRRQVPNRAVHFDGVNPARCHDQQARSPEGFDRFVATHGRAPAPESLVLSAGQNADRGAQPRMNVGLGVRAVVVRQDRDDPP